MNMDMKEYSIAAARDRLPALVHLAERGSPIRLVRRGRPVAVLISAREYERISARRQNFFEAVEEYRRRHDLDSSLHKVFEGTRDRSRGHELRW